MLANIVDIEHEAQRTCLLSERGAIILLDFKAAFPSISHNYLLSVLAALGIPPGIANMVRNLDDGHRCNVSFGGQLHKGFDISAGIRQGCPLSPLLFVLLIDLVLRRIQRLLPNATVQAFVDDIAIVLPDLSHALPILQKLFDDLADIVGLFLNLPKCLLIPLWPTDMDPLRLVLCDSSSWWSRMDIRFSSTYLGFVVGPGQRIQLG